MTDQSLSLGCTFVLRDVGHTACLKYSRAVTAQKHLALSPHMQPFCQIKNRLCLFYASVVT